MLKTENKIETQRPANWATPLQGKPGLPNFHQVSDTLYRGAQPEEEGFAELKKMGIKTVVNLRTFHSDRDECAEAGLDYIKINMQAWEGETEEIVDFLKIVTDPEKQPVFVHCQHGADWTGTVCAFYRMAIEGWSKLSRHDAVDLAQQFEHDGVAAIVFTDIHRDGMMDGLNIEATVAFARGLAIPIIASSAREYFRDRRGLFPFG